MSFRFADAQSAEGATQSSPVRSRGSAFRRKVALRDKGGGKLCEEKNTLLLQAGAQRRKPNSSSTRDSLNS